MICEDGELFEILLADDMVEDLTVKQIRQLSKLISTTRVLSAENKRYDITFESTLAESIFMNYQA